MNAVPHSVLTSDGVAALLDALRRRGFRILGPTVRDRAIVYDDIAALADLPRGWSDEQKGGHYRLVRRDDDALFGYAVGPHSWKKFLHAPAQLLWRAERTGDGMRIMPEPHSAERLALIGVRACELHAIAIQDRVLLGGKYPDARYQARGEAAFLVAVNCAQPGGTCFCVSMNTGPKVAAAGCDLALTEIVGRGEHRFLVEAGSEAGRSILAELPHREATPEDMVAADAVVSRAAAQRSSPAAVQSQPGCV